ncbi:MAG: TonB-dependent receptor [Bacteroidales bacterium]|nr:TonB-dependent receptor [Bacteroidales bacterium]
MKCLINYLSKPHLFRILCISLLLISIIQLNAQDKSVRLYGKIVDKNSMQPLAFANVSIKDKGIGTVTREAGYFNIDATSTEDTLVVNFMGYDTYYERIGDFENPLQILIMLEEGIRQIKEVQIVEKERIIRLSEKISAVKMSPVLIAKLPNLGEVDVMRAFQLMPGVSASNETSSGLYVRGGTPDQNLILFDGMTIYHVDHFYGFFSAFNANTIDDIELIKGGFPAMYGGRTSSVLDITGKPADMKEFQGIASLSLLSVNTSFEIPMINDKVSWQIAARRSYTDLIRTKLYDKVFNLYSNDNEPDDRPTMGRMMEQDQQEPKFHFYDINSKITWKVNDKNTLAYSFYSGKDKLDNSRDLTMGPFGSSDGGTLTDIAAWGNVGMSFQDMMRWNQKLTTTTFLSYSNYFSTRDRKSGDLAPGSNGNVRPDMNTFEDNKVQDVSFRFKNTYYIHENHQLDFGLEESFTNIRYSMATNDTMKMVDRKDHGLITSLYVQEIARVFDDKIQFTTGLRMVHYDVTGKIYPEPRLSFTYKPLRKLKIKTAWGIYNQFHTRIVREDVLQGSKDFWLLANGDLIAVNSATHYITGISYEYKDFIFNAEAYYKDMKGLNEYSMRFTRTPQRNPEGPQEYFFSGSGYAKGIEFLIQKKNGNTTGWIAYTLSEVKYAFPDLNNGKPFYALHDQPNEFKVVACRRLRGWDLSAAFIYATGKPYTAPESEYQLVLLDGTTYNYIHVSDKNSKRLPDYHRLDVSANYNWEGIRTMNTLSFSVFNVYNHKNIWYKEFDISEDEVSSTDVVLLGVTPNISLTVKF